MIGNFEHVSSPVPEDVAVAKKLLLYGTSRCPRLLRVFVPITDGSLKLFLDLHHGISWNTC
jgi:hypothetical protein